MAVPLATRASRGHRTLLSAPRGRILPADRRTPRRNAQLLEDQGEFDRFDLENGPKVRPRKHPNCNPTRLANCNTRLAWQNPCNRGICGELE